jgi:hypothetical protein
MGLKYLGGRSWAEVTRDERFFCQHLFSLIQRDGVARFIAHLNERHEAGLADAGNWEVAYEACFYRDIWHHRKKQGFLCSPKRTFDLCLLSDEAIVIIEAKAQQEFDALQLADFAKDRQRLADVTGVARILLASLASCANVPAADIRDQFNGPHLTWREMAELYGNDAILLRADAVYEPDEWCTGRNNTSGYMTGAELVDAHARGADFLVGRDRGLHGSKLAADIASGDWRSQEYETNRTDPSPPNRNWFRLAEFARIVSAQAARGS